MKINLIKLFAIAVVTLPMLAITAFNTHPVSALSPADDEAAATYKAKCAMCHTAKAEKFFDAAKTDDELVQTTLKGKKGEKPPAMPGFEAKGMTEAQAKALVTYMKELKKPSN